MSLVRDPDRDQPLPKPGGVDVLLNVAAAVLERRAHGAKKYGHPLETGNGRSALRDLLEELLDAAAYTAQAVMEEGQSILPGDDGPPSTAAALATLRNLLAAADPAPPGCTATIPAPDDPNTILACKEPAGHYQERGPILKTWAYWHRGDDYPVPGRTFRWNDTEEGATPHTDPAEAPAGRVGAPRLLDCGWCFEENGEEVHPHPECPVNAFDAVWAGVGRRHALMAAARAAQEQHGAPAPAAETAAPIPTRDDGMRAQYDAAIRPVMLLGLQDADLSGPGGTERIGQWAEFITNTVAGIHDSHRAMLIADLAMAEARAEGAEAVRDVLAHAIAAVWKVPVPQVITEAEFAAAPVVLGNGVIRPTPADLRMDAAPSQRISVTTEPATPAGTLCTATFTFPFPYGDPVTERCIRPAGHYDEAVKPEGDSPGGWHQGHKRPDGVSTGWADTARGATPHGAPTEPTATDPGRLIPLDIPQCSSDCPCRTVTKETVR
ncbi:hypothetical protein ACIP9H_34090 [Streptomyces sp. NPDC088732]|uniref:hypothetical protein n=1 Tax=Streptomyces sp. NPDC088732 TaxID=3365879 RepID=UPI0038092D4A